MGDTIMTLTEEAADSWRLNEGLKAGRQLNAISWKLTTEKKSLILAL